MPTFDRSTLYRAGTSTACWQLPVWLSRVSEGAILYFYDPRLLLPVLDREFSSRTIPVLG